ncbi:hypothetical protein B0H12DRAFT_1304291 [Mycena haematopus]|nr:hypothetical protein B0H12DRAFT_1304291 [Mycena haematopus]
MCLSRPLVVDLGPDASLRFGHSSFDRQLRALAWPPYDSWFSTPRQHSMSIHPPCLHPALRDCIHLPGPPRPAEFDAITQQLQLAISVILSGFTQSSTSHSILMPRAVDMNPEEPKDK